MRHLCPPHYAAEALHADPDDRAAVAAQFPTDLGHLASNPGYWMPGKPIALLRATYACCEVATTRATAEARLPQVTPYPGPGPL